MKCIRCGNETKINKTTEAFELNSGLLVIRNIPCYKCEKCDEIHFSGDVMQQIERIVKQFEEQMQEVTIIEYEKVA